MPAAKPSSRWNSLAVRITVVFTCFVVISTLVAGALVYRSVRDELLQAARTDMDRTAEQARDRMESAARSMAEDITFLSDNDAVKAYCTAVDQRDSAMQQAALYHVELLMGSFIQSRHQYAQVRLIAADGPGREAVRFDRSEESVLAVPKKDLQLKGDRDYFRATMLLAPGDHYFSPIDLNREQGRIAVPHMPTLRAAAPLVAASGRRVGIVVINADLRPLFKEILLIEREHQVLVLADPSGNLLLHPDTALTFRHELGGSFTVQDLLRMRGGEDAWIMARTEWGSGSLGRPYRLQVLISRDDLLAGLRTARNTSLAITAAIALIFALLSLFYARSIGRVLTRLTERVERYAHGEGQPSLPVERTDEIGRLARSLSFMQDRIDDRVKELQEARNKAENSDKARRDLLANMSHEVRTPLSAIIGMSDELDSSRLDPEDRTKLEIVRRSAHRLQGLVEDLLLNERMQEGRLALRPQRVDLSTVVNDIALVHEKAAVAKGLTLVNGSDPSLGHGLIDPLRFHQVLDNLVGNAVKFTPSGTVTLTVSRGAGMLDIGVSDTGPGIAEKDLGRIFDRFERAASNDLRDAGAGLGLAITRRLVELMGGTLKVESCPGSGTRFLVRLPVPEGPMEDVRGPVDPSLVKGLRILHVEDVATNRMLMASTAKALGWELVQCGSAKEALAIAPELAVDLFLIDVDLGEGTRGTTLARMLRDLERHRATPMIAVTAYADEQHFEEVLVAGMNDLLVKPLKRNDLVELVTFWCDRSPGPCEKVDMEALHAQYDHDTAELPKVLEQYQDQFKQWRLSLLHGSTIGNKEGLQRTCHQLRPHLELLGMKEGVVLVDRVHSTPQDERSRAGLIQVVRCVDRALLRSMRALRSTKARKDA